MGLFCEDISQINFCLIEIFKMTYKSLKKKLLNENLYKLSGAFRKQFKKCGKLSIKI